jgi:porin
MGQSHPSQSGSVRIWTERTTFFGGLIALLLQSGLYSTWAQPNPETNEVATLGAAPAEYRLTRPTPPSPSVNTNREWFGGLPWWQWSRLIGDWASVRPLIETNGLVFAGSFASDTSAGVGHNLSSRGVERGLLNLNLTYDPQPLLGIPGGTFFVQYYQHFGRNGSDVIGDLQGFDNMDAPYLNQLQELWYQQNLYDGVIRIKAGQVDANDDFDNLSAAADFLNSSAGYSPTLLNFPTYPYPAVSVSAFVYPAQWVYIGGGVYTANLTDFTIYPVDHPYLLGEVGILYNGTGGRLGPGKVAAGVWHDTGQVQCFDGSMDNGSTGYYFIAQEEVWNGKPGDMDDDDGIMIFVQYGEADSAVSEVGQHVGVGASAFGILPGRDNDAMGIYWTWANLSRDVDAGFTHNESSLEIFYRCQALQFLAIQPDVQWINNPGGTGDVKNAWIGTIRLVTNF